MGNVYLIVRDSKGHTTSTTKCAIAQGGVWEPKLAIVKLADVPNEAISLQFMSSLGPGDIQDLRLSDLAVTDKALAEIGKLKGLQALQVDGTEVTDEGLRQLDLPKLGGLDLEHTGITDLGISYMYKFLPRIDYLSLRDTKVTDNGLAKLIGLNRLATLILSNTPVTDAGMVYIKRMRKLSALELAGDNITDDGLSTLAGMSTLTKLDLRETKITDRSVDVLSGMHALEHLNIGGTSISAVAFGRLKESLPRCAVSVN